MESNVAPVTDENVLSEEAVRRERLDAQSNTVVHIADRIHLAHRVRERVLRVRRRAEFFRAGPDVVMHRASPIRARTMSGMANAIRMRLAAVFASTIDDLRLWFFLTEMARDFATLATLAAAELSERTLPVFALARHFEHGWLLREFITARTSCIDEHGSGAVERTGRGLTLEIRFCHGALQKCTQGAVLIHYAPRVDEVTLASRHSRQCL